MLKKVLDFAQESDGSDVHLSVGSEPIVRVDGVLQRVLDDILTEDDLELFLGQILTKEQRAVFDDGNDVDMAYVDDHGNRYRVNVYRQRRTPSIVLRLLNGVVPSIDDFKLPPVIKELALKPRGLVLVTGPTGSGKSTTLAAMIDYINESRAKHILTLEDPIEYVHQNKKSLINQREIGTDSKSFNESLKSALREDPDVILVGEMRDFETIQLAITAAETGHLVLSTLHTIGAPDTINRIIDSFPPHQQSQVRSQLSTSLQAVVSQVLVPTKKGGRVAAHEIMVTNDGIGNLIRDGKIVQISSTMQTGAKEGMITLDKSLGTLVRQGVINLEDALEFSKDRKTIERHAR